MQILPSFLSTFFPYWTFQQDTRSHVGCPVVTSDLRSDRASQRNIPSEIGLLNNTSDLWKGHPISNRKPLSSDLGSDVWKRRQTSNQTMKWSPILDDVDVRSKKSGVRLGGNGSYYTQSVMPVVWPLWRAAVCREISWVFATQERKNKTSKKIVVLEASSPTKEAWQKSAPGFLTQKKKKVGQTTNIMIVRNPLWERGLQNTVIWLWSGFLLFDHPVQGSKNRVRELESTVQPNNLPLLQPEGICYDQCFLFSTSGYSDR